MEQRQTDASLFFWNRRFLTTYWLLAIILMLTTTINWLLEGGIGNAGDWLVFLLPSLLSLAILLVSEGLIRLMKKRQEYLIILTGTAMSFVIIALQPAIQYIQALFTIPILVSIFYFQKRLVIFACALNIALFFLLTGLLPDFRANTSPKEWVTMPVILFVEALISIRVMSRAIELASMLKKESAARQDLLVQNVLMDKLTKTDALTDLYNHLSFQSYLERLVDYAEHDGFQLHLAILDIDNFKKVNDNYGHHVGDLVLKRVSAVIKETVTPNDFTARYGGEEFTIIFTEKTLDQAYQLVEKIRKKVANLTHPELQGASVTISAGLNSFNKGEAKMGFFEKADAFLYKAKQTGKNRTVYREVV
jgi:diguanylate cyclase